MKLITRLWTSLFFACVCVFIGSCTSNNENSSTQRTIRFWHFWSEPSQKGAVRELVDKFEKQYGVRVELTELSWNDGKTKLQAAFNSGQPPDVIELGSDWVAQFSAAGVLLPLPASELPRFMGYSTAPAMWQGKVYAYPWTLDTRVLWVNTDLTAPPTTMTEVLTYAERVASKGGNGWGANGSDAHRLYKKILPFFWTFGGDVLGPDGKPVLNSAENVAAVAMYAQLARTGFVETQRQLDAAFVQGRIAMWNSGSWLTKKISTNSALKAVPTLFPSHEGRPGVSFAGGEYLAVSAATKNTQVSRDLVMFLTQGANAVAFCKAVPEAGFPADTKYYADSALIADPVKAVFARQLDAARMTPVHPRWLDIEAIIEDAVVRVLMGETDARSALDAAQREVSAIVGG